MRLYVLRLMASIPWLSGCGLLTEPVPDPIPACKNVASLHGAGPLRSRHCLDKLALERKEEPASYSALVKCMTSANSTTAIDSCIDADSWFVRKTKQMYDQIDPAAKAKISRLAAVARRIPELQRLDENKVALSGTIPTRGLCVLDAGTLHSMFGMPVREKDRQRPFQTPNARPCGLLLLGPKSRAAYNFMESDAFDYEVSELAHTEYVLVVKTFEWAAPGKPENKMTGFVPTPGVKVFEPGSYRGEAHLFSLSDGKHLGGFRIEATNSESMFSHGASQEDLAKDLDRHVWAALRDGIERFIPQRGETGSGPRP
ncbi:MAG: hypothetical protein JW940_35310 [Polyangiaceae bacterium]|nr:hypothetical protein [Polyangiaceae bacterium]